MELFASAEKLLVKEKYLTNVSTTLHEMLKDYKCIKCFKTLFKKLEVDLPYDSAIQLRSI